MAKEKRCVAALTRRPALERITDTLQIYVLRHGRVCNETVRGIVVAAEAAVAAPKAAMAVAAAAAAAAVAVAEAAAAAVAAAAAGNCQLTQRLL